MYRIALLLLATSLIATEEDVRKASEAIGHILGKNLEEFGLELDMNAVVKGLKEEVEGTQEPLEECMQTISSAQEKKISLLTEETLRTADRLSNSNQMYENHSLPTSNSSEYR